MARKKSYRGSKHAADRFSRRQFLVRSAAGIAGASLSSLGYPWGDLAYGQQLKGKPIKFNVAVRPDWTQGWFGVVNEEKQIWKKYLPEGSEVTFSHPIQGGIVTNELIANKTSIGHNGDAPGLIATFQRERADIRAIGLIGSSPSGYHCYQILARTDAPEFKDSKEALRWFDGKVVATPKGSCSDRFFQDVFKREGIKPKEYLNQPIGVITTNLRAKKIDGAARSKSCSCKYRVRTFPASSDTSLIIPTPGSMWNMRSMCLRTYSRSASGTPINAAITSAGSRAAKSCT